MGKIFNDTLLKVLARQSVTHTPVWIMRQAGRYMPEYRALRERAGSFLNLCRTPELACEATLLPIRRYALDAAILFSDILLLADVMGLELEFLADSGPRFGKVIRSVDDFGLLRDIDVNLEMDYVRQAIILIKRELAGRVPLIGFAGNPWTLATYMVEGQASKQFAHIKGLMYSQPHFTHQLLQHLAEQVVKYLQLQIAAGVDVVMLFDSWGGIFAKYNHRDVWMRNT